jgi:hypothetical protein
MKQEKMPEEIKKPKISFGIIVLNGEPFTKYCLRSIYPYAHEIIIVEGATENAKSISTPEGHSLDDTLKKINEFIFEEDATKKVKLITRESFWKEKNEMSEAYSSMATGNFLWQIDIDEFYLKDDMEKIVSILEKDPPISAISFKMKSFWGGVSYTEEGPIFGDINRLFKFGPGYKYINHRPPTVVDNNGINLRKINWLDGTVMAKRYGIYMHHYGLIFPLQVSTKTKYYVNAFKKDSQKWADNNFFKLRDPFHVNNNFWRISWLNRYKGKHPEQIVKMMNDIETKAINTEERDSVDVEKLLKSPAYIISTHVLRTYFRFVFKCKRLAKKILIFFNVLEIK